jgi:hypothetical protein
MLHGVFEAQPNKGLLRISWGEGYKQAPLVGQEERKQKGNSIFLSYPEKKYQKYQIKKN